MDIKLNDWFIERVMDEASQIRAKMLNGRYMGVEIDEFLLEHPDVAIVCAYYLGSADNSLSWRQSVLDIIKKDDSDDSIKKNI